MRWEDERYVRAYTRDTTDWLMLSWKAQGLFLLILRKVDRAGILDLGKHGKCGLSSHVGGIAAWSEVEPALDELLKDGCVQFVDDPEESLLVVPNFVEAQEAKQSDKARKRAERERARDMARHGKGVTNRDEASESGQTTTGDRVSVPEVLEQDANVQVDHKSDQIPSIVTIRDTPSVFRTESHNTVTPRPVQSHGVTPSLAVPSLAKQKLEPDPDNPDRPPLRLQFAAAIRRHPVFDCIDADEKAAAIERDFWSVYSTRGTKVDWWLASIDECGSKSSGTGLSIEALSSRLSGFARNTKPPRREMSAGQKPTDKRPNKTHAAAAAAIDERMRKRG